MQTKPVVLSPAQVGLAAFAAKDDASYRGMNVINVTSELAEATNGHIAARIKHDGMDADDFPSGLGVPKLTGPNGKSIQISVDAVKNGARFTKVKSRIPILARAIVGTDSEGRGIIASTDLESVAVGQTPQDERRPYPDLDTVIPSPEGKIRVGLSAEYLKALAEFAIKHNGRKATPVVFYFDPKDSETACCRVEVPLSDGRQLVGALMPMRA